MKTVLYTISTLQRSGPALVLYGLVKNLDRSHIRPVVLTLSAEKENSLKPEFEKLGVELLCLNTRGWKTFASGARKYRQLVQQVRPDIIHANGFRDIVLAAYAAPKTYFKCATIHCDWEVDYRLKYGRLIGMISSWLQRGAVEKIAVRIACSEMLAGLLNQKYPALHFDYVNNGVDTDKFYPSADKAALRRKLGLPADKKIVIWAGSFIPRKNPLIMAEAVAQLQDEKLYFVFCGARGELLTPCKEQLKACANVLFTGYITNIEEYYQAADIYVSTSKSEGLPLAVLEAQFCGLVPLLSDIGQHRYILPQDRLADCLYSNTVADLVAKLRARSTEDNAALLETCAAYVTRFSAAEMSHNYRKLYERALQK